MGGGGGGGGGEGGGAIAPVCTPLATGLPAWIAPVASLNRAGTLAALRWGPFLLPEPL